MPRRTPQIPVTPIVVVKIGSAVLAPEGALDPASIDRLAADIARAARSHRVVIVSSGAVASGFGAMGLPKPPKEIMLKQAAAAVGQSRLMRAWSDAFARHGITVAQVLLTADDLDHRARHLNARNTLLALLERAIIPIINENDSVAFDEIKLGDNDRLSSLVAGLVGARQLLILSTAHGLYEHGNSKKIVLIVTDLAAARAHVSGTTSSVGTGGMHTKLDAVATAAAAGVATVIAGGIVPDVVTRVLGGERVGTSFPIATKRVGARKRWIGYASKVKGAIVVDEGARVALTQRGASLLPSGVTGVEGEFDAGAVVELLSAAAGAKAGAKPRAFARGRVSYAAGEVRTIAGKPAKQIAALLGYVYRDEVVHRDDLVLLDASDGKGSPGGSS
jgi:glutamate 5-kinase